MSVHADLWAAGPAEIQFMHGGTPAYPYIVDATGGAGKGRFFLSQSAAEFLHSELGAHLALLEADERDDAALAGIAPETHEVDR